MNKETIKQMELIMAMYIIAVGEWDGICFIDYPKLPKPFSENVDMGDDCVGDLLSLRVDPYNLECGVQFWFMDEDENHFICSWDEVVKTKPMLAVAAFTHIFDMIENYE